MRTIDRAINFAPVTNHSDKLVAERLFWYKFLESSVISVWHVL